MLPVVPVAVAHSCRKKFACYMWEGYRRHTGPELDTKKFACKLAREEFAEHHEGSSIYYDTLQTIRGSRAKSSLTHALRSDFWRQPAAGRDAVRFWRNFLPLSPLDVGRSTTARSSPCAPSLLIQ